MEYFRRYRLPDAELSLWCRRPTWTTEEATALSIGLDPALMSLRSIGQFLLARLHSSTGNRWLDERVELYLARHKQLARAARFGELPAAPSEEGYNISPIDFLDWVMRQNVQKPWGALPPPLSMFVADRGPVIVAPFGAKDLDTGKGKAGGSSLGVPKGKRGPDACGDYLRSEMKKSREDAEFNDQGQYRLHCKKKFGISGRVFDRAWTEAATETDCAWAKRGRPRKTT
jgi:hypothetical protein